LSNFTDRSFDIDIVDRHLTIDRKPLKVRLL
jgi:hypothetical protein